MMVSWPFFYASDGMEGLYKIFYVGFIAIAAWPAFQKAITSAMYGPEFWEAKIANGWTPLPTHDFYWELARYKRERGVYGQLPGDVAWALAYTAVYLSTMVFGILLVWTVFGWADLAILTVFSLVEFPLAFGLMFLYSRRNRRQFDQAVSAGYQFSQSRLGALHRLQP